MSSIKKHLSGSEKRRRKAEVEVSVSKSAHFFQHLALLCRLQISFHPSLLNLHLVGTHHIDDVISASAHTEPTTEALTPTTPACIDVAPDESISMDDLLTETVHQVDQENAAFIHQMETDPALWSISEKMVQYIGCELVQSYVGTEMEYLRILQGKESQTGKLLIQFHCTLSRYIFKIHKVINLLRAQYNSNRICYCCIEVSSWISGGSKKLV